MQYPGPGQSTDIEFELLDPDVLELDILLNPEFLPYPKSICVGIMPFIIRVLSNTEVLRYSKQWT
jgi:hypothetical protein